MLKNQGRLKDVQETKVDVSVNNDAEYKWTMICIVV